MIQQGHSYAFHRSRTRNEENWGHYYGPIYVCVDLNKIKQLHVEEAEKLENNKLFRRLHKENVNYLQRLNSQRKLQK